MGWYAVPTGAMRSSSAGLDAVAGAGAGAGVDALTIEEGAGVSLGG